MIPNDTANDARVHEVDRSLQRLDVSDANQFRDITDEFLAAASSLQASTLVKDASLSLFDSVGALEIMDPKMDSGVLTDAFDQDGPCDVDLPAGDIVNLMDQILASEMTWHSGSALLQTVYASKHIITLLLQYQQSKSIDEVRFQIGDDCVDLLNHVLKPYIFATIKACDILRQELQCGNLYEDEDVSTYAFELSLLEEIEVNEVKTVLFGAVEWLESARHTYPQEITPKAFEALSCRLLFRVAFLEAFDYEYGAKQAVLKECLNLLSTIEASTYTETKIDTNTFFTISIQRKLASTVPPRPMVRLETVEAFHFVRRLLEDSNNIFNIFVAPSAATLKDYFLEFSGRKPLPCAFVRSCLQSCFLQDDVIAGSVTAREFVLQDMAKYVDVPSVLLNFQSTIPQSKEFDRRMQYESLFENCTRTFLQMFRAFGYNRSRMRRVLSHNLADWEVVHQQAINLEPQQRSGNETFIVNHPVTSWILHQKFFVAEVFFHLGFELEVFLPREFAMVSLYQYHLHTQHAELLELFLKNAANDKQKDAGRLKSDMINLRYQNEINNLFRFFARSMFLLSVILLRRGSIEQALNPQTSMENVFSFRFKEVAGLSVPAPLTFEDYNSSTSSVSLELAIEEGEKSIQMAKESIGRLNKEHLKCLETRPNVWRSPLDLRSLLRSLIGTSLALHALSNYKDPKVTVETTCFHPYFPVLKLSES